MTDMLVKDHEREAARDAQELLGELGAKPVVFRRPWCECYRSGDILVYSEATKRYHCPHCGSRSISGDEARTELWALRRQASEMGMWKDRAVNDIVRLERSRSDIRDEHLEMSRKWLATMKVLEGALALSAQAYQEAFAAGYRHVADDPDEPWMCSDARADLLILRAEYKALKEGRAPTPTEAPRDEGNNPA